MHLLYFSGDAQGGDLFYVKSRDFQNNNYWSEPLRVE